MKKVLAIVLVAVMALTACSNKNPNAGNYSGTFNFITNNINKDGKMLFVSNPINGSLLLYSVVPLDQTSTGSYMTSSANLDYITSMLQNIAGSNNIYNTATEQIKNVKIEATFSGNTVYCEMYYTIALISDITNTRISIVKFNGTK